MPGLRLVRSTSLRNESGFILNAWLIDLFLAIILVTTVFSFFGEDIKASLKENAPPSNTEQPVVKFKSYPPTPVKKDPVLPPEPQKVDDNAGKPIEDSVAGEWHGRYTATSPPMFRGKGGGWEAHLSEDGMGSISGNFSSDFGISGQVKGSSKSKIVYWYVNSKDGLNFKGKLKGHTLDGEFWGEVFEGQQARGTFFGGRIVKNTGG